MGEAGGGKQRQCSRCWHVHNMRATVTSKPPCKNEDARKRSSEEFVSFAHRFFPRDHVPREEEGRGRGHPSTSAACICPHSTIVNASEWDRQGWSRVPRPGPKKNLSDADTASRKRPMVGVRPFHNPHLANTRDVDALNMLLSAATTAVHRSIVDGPTTTPSRRQVRQVE